MKSIFSIALIVTIFVPVLSGQNVGIDIENPSEKLQVSGIIHTTEGGLRFPDGSLQTTAAMNTTSSGDLPEYMVKTYMAYDNIDTNTPDYTEWVKLYGVSYDHIINPGGSQPCMSNLTILKSLDNFSVDLHRNNFTRTSIDDVEIHYTITINGVELPVVILTIDQILIEKINSVNTSIGNGKYKLIEEIKLLNAGGITLTYNKYNSQGAVTSTATEVICN